MELRSNQLLGDLIAKGRNKLETKIKLHLQKMGFVWN
jgi:hypothetical protein